MPLLGPWTAQLELDSAVPPTGNQTIDWDGVTFSSTVVRSGTDEGNKSQALLVGGKGGLSKTLSTPKYYASGPTLGTIVADILTEAGETLSGTADSSVLGHVVARWERAVGAAGNCLTTVLEQAGATWRVLADGTVWVGKDTFPAAARTDVPGLTVLDEQYGTGNATISIAAPLLRPGVTLLDRPVREVAFTLTPGAFRAIVRFQSLGDVLARLLERASRKGDYSGKYPGKAVAYSAGQADLVPDDERVRGIGGTSRVPVRIGVPGLTLETVSGSRRAAVSFEGNDPKRPVIAEWEQGGQLKIGTILLAQNAVSFALLPPQFFPAGTVGDLAATAAQAAIALAGNTAFLLPLEITKVVASD